LNNLTEANITHLLHVGDFAVYDIEKLFACYPQIQIFIARGNCDVNEEIITAVQKLPNCTIAEIINLELSGIKIVASHIENAIKKLPQKNSSFNDRENIDVFCYGHTHRTRLEKQGKKLILNPGALCEDGRYFLLTLPELKVEQKFFNEKL